MPTRIAVALVAVAAFASPAHAARYCRLVTDDGTRRVDNVVQEKVLPGSTADLHIRSADIASDGRYLTAAIRLYKSSSTDPTASTQARRYQFSFYVRGTEYDRWWLEMRTGVNSYVRLYRKVTTQTSPVSWHDEITIAGPGRSVVDTKRAEIRMTAPLSLLGPVGRRAGTPLTELVASVDQIFADGATTLDDEYGGYFRHAIAAPESRAYPLGARSCVPVGR